MLCVLWWISCVNQASVTLHNLVKSLETNSSLKTIRKHQKRYACVKYSVSDLVSMSWDMQKNHNISSKTKLRSFNCEFSFSHDRVSIHQSSHLAGTHLFWGGGEEGSHYYNTNKCQNGERDQYADINLSRRYAMYQTWQTLCVSIHTYALFNKTEQPQLTPFYSFCHWFCH